MIDKAGLENLRDNAIEQYKNTANTIDLMKQELVGLERKLYRLDGARMAFEKVIEDWGTASEDDLALDDTSLEGHVNGLVPMSDGTEPGA
jgi:hypothetical protein